MSAEAREAVARALYQSLWRSTWESLPEHARKNWYTEADAALAALQPIIAAEIRAVYGNSTLADAIASRICDHTMTGEHQ